MTPSRRPGSPADADPPLAEPASPAPQPGAVEISIVICTFHRPALLRRAVASCLAQEAAPRFEVIVVDNSETGTAAAAVQAMAAADSRVIYHPLPRPNIALARDAGLARARGRYVAFLDDDQEADRDWLAELHAVLERTGADCACGPVMPRFEGGAAPAWDPAGWRFTRRLDLPTGSTLRIGRHPGSARGIGTGNSMLRRDAAPVAATRFDPALGRSGGEDTDFFIRVARGGGRIVWSAGAGVAEWIPAERSSLGYMLERSRHGTQLYARSVVRAARRPALARASMLLRGALQFGLALLVMATARRDSGRWVEARFRRAAAAGKLALSPASPSYAAPPAGEAVP